MWRSLAEDDMIPQRPIRRKPSTTTNRGSSSLTNTPTNSPIPNSPLTSSPMTNSPSTKSLMSETDYMKRMQQASELQQQKPDGNETPMMTNPHDSHVFILQGEPTKLCCDAVLLPSFDNFASVHKSLFPNRQDKKFKQNKEEKALYEAAKRLKEKKWPADQAYRTIVKFGNVDEFINMNWPKNRPHPWFCSLDATTVSLTYPDVVKEFLSEVNREFELVASLPKFKRERYLVAIPVVGSATGDRSANTQMVRALLNMVYRTEYRFDIAIMCNESAVSGAAQAARRQLAEKNSNTFDPFFNLSKDLKREAEKLGKLAFDGNLVLFVGAGLSNYAGIPSWGDMLTFLATEAAIISAEKPKVTKMFSSMSALDQANLIEKKKGAEWLHDHVTKLVEGSHYSVPHSLLSSLPISETVTTNYDTLFEQACNSWGCKLSILPYETRKMNQTEKCKWILKMHGCVTHPEDIVLTREDYIQYSERKAALAGIVQTLLITKHMLFIGFSLNDENFFKIASTVKKAMPGAPEKTESHAEKEQHATTTTTTPAHAGQRKPKCNGTVLNLKSDKMLDELWKSDFDMISMSNHSDTEGLRIMEIFLDYIAANSVTCTKYTMDKSFGDVLTQEEKLFRDCLEKFLKDLPAVARNSGSYLRFIEILQNEFGWDK